MTDDSDGSSPSDGEHDLCYGCGPPASIGGFPSRYPIERFRDMASRLKRHVRKHSVNDVIEELSVCERCGEIIIKPKEENVENEYYEDEFVTLHNTQWVPGVDEETRDELRDVLFSFEEFEGAERDDEAADEAASEFFSDR